MSVTNVETKTRQISIRAVVTRADGTIENLGLISFQSTSPLKMWLYRMGQKLGLFRR